MSDCWESDETMCEQNNNFIYDLNVEALFS